MLHHVLNSMPYLFESKDMLSGSSKIYNTVTVLHMMTPKRNCSQEVSSTTSAFVGTVHTASLAVCTVLIIFVLLMGCIGNSVVIYAAVKKKRIRTNFDVLVLNLTGADFITCTFLAPTYLFLLYSEPPVPKMFCGSVLFLGAASGMLSLFTLVAIALHRLARVVGQASGTLSITRTAIILAMIWIFSFTLSVGGTLHVTHNWNPNQKTCQAIINSSNPQLQNFVLFFVAPVTIVSFVIVALSYIIITIMVHRQTDKLSKTVSTPPCKQCRNLIRQNCPSRKCHTCSNSTFPYRDNKALTMCLVVILLMGLCWGPLIISHFVELATGESITLYQVKLCGIALVFLNSALDPYIYAQHIGKIKQRYSKLFKLVLQCCSNNKAPSRLRATDNKKPKAIAKVGLDSRFNHDTSPGHNSTRELLDECRTKGNIEQTNFHKNLIMHSDIIRNSNCNKGYDIMKTCLVEESIGFINASCSQGSGRDIPSTAEFQ